MSLASCRLDGDNAAIARGLRSHWRKNVHASGCATESSQRADGSRRRGRSWDIRGSANGNVAMIARRARPAQVRLRFRRPKKRNPATTRGNRRGADTLVTGKGEGGVRYQRLNIAVTKA